MTQALARLGHFVFRGRDGSAILLSIVGSCSFTLSSGHLDAAIAQNDDCFLHISAMHEALIVPPSFLENR